MEADHNFNVRAARIVQCSYTTSTGVSSRLGVTLRFQSVLESMRVYMTPDEARKLAQSLLAIADDADRHKDNGSM